MNTAPFRRRLAVVAALGIGGAIALSGCASVPDIETPDIPDVESVQAEAIAENFFGELAAGSAAGAIRGTTLDIDTHSESGILMTDEAYGAVEGRPQLREVTGHRSDEGELSVDLHYELNGESVEETVALTEPDPDSSNNPKFFVISPDEFGISFAGFDELPATATIALGELDITAAVRGSFTDDASRVLPSGTLPAFGGTYTFTVTVPGESGFSREVVVETSSFKGAVDQASAFEDIAESA